MRDWSVERIAAAAAARLLRTGEGWPSRAVVDTREVEPGDLFVGLRGARVDGGAYAQLALDAGAWGVLVAPQHAQALLGVPASGSAAGEAAGGQARATTQGAVLAHSDPLAALHALACAWRRALGAAGARVVAVTGSTGKTTTKDILAAVLRSAEAELGGPIVASRGNLNTEVGLPLTLLAAPPGTSAVVVEMAMRGRGQIAQLTALAEPEVGVIVNVGPAHLEQVGSLEGVAAAKAELIAGMAPGSTVVVPADEPLLAPHLRADVHTVTFGPGGDVELAAPGIGGEAASTDEEVARNADAEAAPGAAGEAAPTAGRESTRSAGGVRPTAGGQVTILDRRAGGERIVLRPSFTQSHNLRNLLAAVAAARALGVTPAGRLEVELSPLRGERIALADGITVINDCYNANPTSMRAALDDLAASATGRRVAVLGEMLELGAEAPRWHREIGAHAHACGVELLIAVGPLAAEMGEGEGVVYPVADAAAAAALLPELLRAGDCVLVKGSRGVGLEVVAERLAAVSAFPHGAETEPAGPAAARHGRSRGRPEPAGG